MKHYIKIFLFITVTTTLVALPRFAHHTPDSPFYVITAEYFQGSTERMDLEAPYVYRVLVPAFVALLPSSDINFNFGLVNLLFTVFAYFVFYFYLRTFFTDNIVLFSGLLILIFSFPTFNYGSGVLTDSAGFFFLITAAYLFAKERLILLCCVLTVGIFARETGFIIICAFILYGMLNKILSLDLNINVKHVLFMFPPLIAYFAIRQYFSDIPNYFWLPTIERVVNNLVRPVSWATVLLTIGPLIIFIFIGLIITKRTKGIPTFVSKFSTHQLLILYTLSISCSLLFVYSVLTAFMSGRFIWPLYIVLIPICLLFVEQTLLDLNIPTRV